MQFFVQGNDVLTKATDPKLLKDRVPGFNDSMDAASDLRQFYQETGQNEFMAKAGWKHIATISAPVEAVANLLNPEWLNGNGKRDFYRWVDSHPGYLAYDRRAALAKRQFFGWTPQEAVNGTSPDSSA